jgi:hypothetical protein
MLTSRFFKFSRDRMQVKIARASESHVYDPEHHHHSEPNMSSLKVRVWCAACGRAGSWLSGLLMWMVLKRTGVVRLWKWWDTRERCFSGIEGSELEEFERKEKMIRRTSSQSEVSVRGGVDMVVRKNWVLKCEIRA